MDEYRINDDSFILSKTDTKGIITYCNEEFLKASEYTLDEILKKPHNIIRHPDMPKATFKLVWDLIKNQKDFYGFVKNKRKNGGFYWVFAYISQDYNEHGKIIGYTSIRRKANNNAIAAISEIYKEMKQIEATQGMMSSEKFLNNKLKEVSMDYNEFILKLQEGRL